MPGERGGVRLRKAEAGDSERILVWRNLPEIVALSGSGETVTLEQHESWFRQAVVDPNRLVLIVERDGVPIGQVRFEQADGAFVGRRAVVSIYVVPGQERRGTGTAAIKEGCRLALARWKDLEAIDALVLTGNVRAQRFFEAAGFERVGEAPVDLWSPERPQVCLRLMRQAFEESRGAGARAIGERS